MKILLTGGSGQVGWELRRVLSTQGEVIAPSRDILDLAQPETIRAAIRASAPAVIVNAGAYTAVDPAEDEPDTAQAINGIAPGILAEEARRLGAILIHYSTDYVFNGGKDLDGEKPEPYRESDATHPRCVYGRTKLAGEKAIEAVGGRYLILRTSWIYGARGANFLRTMLWLFREHEVLRIVSDQVGAPTWCRTVAEATGQILALVAASGSASGSAQGSAQGSAWGDGGKSGGLSGIYHLTAGGRTTWYDFARAIAERDPQQEHHRVRKFEPVSTEQYGAKAKRPLNSRLDCHKIGRVFGIFPADWLHDLDLVMEELREGTG